MAVAALHAAERRLVEGLHGLAVLLFKGHGDERLDARLVAAVFPGEGVDDAPVFLDRAILAAHPRLPVSRGHDAGAPTAAWPEVELQAGAGEVLGPEPANH